MLRDNVSLPTNLIVQEVVLFETAMIQHDGKAYPNTIYSLSIEGGKGNEHHLKSNPFVQLQIK